ncbi:MAG: type II toxin-antitoxin system VapC family toxin [Chloroflexi bacterium]|nr:type II toxin-antitoxin system VapC family toxin [Chloroflexota bacterium]
MIVVDTNLLAYLFLTGPRSAQAERALRKDPVWVAPLLWRSEFRNVLAQYLRQGRLSFDDALRIWDAARRLMAGREYEVRGWDVLDLVRQSPCSAYDCEFVALAQSLGVPLVTVDRQILQAFPRVALSLDAFVGPVDASGGHG